MKIIVISGSYSNTGKTTLARNIKNKLVPLKVEIVKIGHNPPKETKQEKLFKDIKDGLNYIQELKKEQYFDFVIIESNSVLKYLEPDLAIFLAGEDQEEKDSARLAREKADIIVNSSFDYDKAKSIVEKKLGLTGPAMAIKNQYVYYLLRKVVSENVNAS